MLAKACLDMIACVFPLAGVSASDKKLLFGMANTYSDIYKAQDLLSS